MATGPVVEKVADQLDTVSTHVEEVAEVTRRVTGREFGFFVAGTGLGIAAGFAAGYFALGKRLQTKYEKVADEEIAKMRDHYQQLTVALRGEAERRRPLEEIVVEKGYATEGTDRVFTEEEQAAIDEANARYPAEREEAAEAPQVVSTSLTDVVRETHSIFVEGDGAWSYADEIAKRDPQVPYIIHVDEFRQNEPGFDQLTFTYYEQDDSLVDSREQLIDDMDAAIGLGNLERWGHGSNDPNIVYVRNEELGADIEIIRDQGRFHDSMPTIRHSSDTRREVRRGFDDD